MVEKTHYLEWQAMQGRRGWGDEPPLCPSDSWRSEFSKGKEHLVPTVCQVTFKVTSLSPQPWL